MANIKSARKRARQAVKRRSHNVSLHTAARSAIKDVKKAIAAGDKKAAAAALVKSQSAHARRRHRMNERRIRHAMVAAERGHHAAQALGPVARPEGLAVQRHALDQEFDNDVAGRFLGHAELY